MRQRERAEAKPKVDEVAPKVDSVRPHRNLQALTKAELVLEAEARGLVVYESWLKSRLVRVIEVFDATH
jgi:hypothetical protein